MTKTIKPYTTNLDQVLGAALIDIRVPSGSSLSLARDEELILDFDNGSELTIFRHPDGTLHIEGD